MFLWWLFTLPAILVSCWSASVISPKRFSFPQKKRLFALLLILALWKASYNLEGSVQRSTERFYLLSSRSCVTTGYSIFQSVFIKIEWCRHNEKAKHERTCVYRYMSIERLLFYETIIIEWKQNKSTSIYLFTPVLFFRKIG